MGSLYLIIVNQAMQVLSILHASLFFKKCTDPHDVDDVLTAHRPVVFVVSSAPRRDGGGAGAAPADC